MARQLSARSVGVFFILLLLLRSAIHPLIETSGSGKFHFIVWDIESLACARHGVTIKLDCYLNFDLARFDSTILVWLAGWLARIHAAHF